MSTPNLAITHMATSQSQKEVTFNAAIDALDSAIAGYSTIALADVDLVLTSAQALGAMHFRFTGALTAARNVVMPVNTKLYVFRNLTTGGFAITVKTPAGAGVTIPNGAVYTVACNGTDVVLVATSGNALQLQGTPIDATAPTDGQALIYDATGQVWKPGAGGSGSSVPASVAATPNTLAERGADGSVAVSTLLLANGTEIADDASGRVLLGSGAGNGSLKIFGGYTDPLNNDYLSIASAGGAISVFTTKVGTGVVSNLYLRSGGTYLGLGASGAIQFVLASTGFVPQAANAYDLGVANAPMRNIYVGTSVVSPKFTTGTATWTSGTGSPEGAVTAPVGSLYTRTDGGAGTTLYVKESGTGNTGWVAKGSGSFGALTGINAQTGTSYTLALSDVGADVDCTNSNPVTVTVPPNSTVAFPVGAFLFVSQGGAGTVTIAPGSGVTLKGATGFATSGQDDVRGLEQIATDVWRVV